MFLLIATIATVLLAATVFSNLATAHQARVEDDTLEILDLDAVTGEVVYRLEVKTANLLPMLGE